VHREVELTAAYGVVVLWGSFRLAKDPQTRMSPGRVPFPGRGFSCMVPHLGGPAAPIRQGLRCRAHGSEPGLDAPRAEVRSLRRTPTSAQFGGMDARERRRPRGRQDGT